MLYSEFVENTGCRETDHNYKVYKELEIIYMNTDCTKEHIYEMGRKLVDNSKSPEQMELEEQIASEIEVCKSNVKYYREEAKRYEEFAKIEQDPIWKKYWKNDAKHAREEARKYRNTIAELKWILE